MSSTQNILHVSILSLNLAKVQRNQLLQRDGVTAAWAKDLLGRLCDRLQGVQTIFTEAFASGVFSGSQKFIFRLFSSSVRSSYLRLNFSTVSFICRKSFSSFVSVLALYS